MGRYTRNQRTRDWIKEQNLIPWKVEQFNAFSGKKTDLLFIIDYLGIGKDKTVGVQSCGADFNQHIIKLFVHERENVKLWLNCQNRQLILIGWTKRKDPKSKVTLKQGAKMIWFPRIWKITLKKGKLFYEVINGK